MLRAGICGYGGLGHLHANTLSKMADVNLCAVCDKRPEQLRAKEIEINLKTDPNTFDITTAATYLDFDEMLAGEDLDVVVTALPTDLHAEYAVEALEAGCHVFSEKPMALTSRQADSMIAARDRAGKQLMIGQCLRFWPEYIALLDVIREERYGKLQSLCMERIGGYIQWSSDDWMNQTERSGSAILDLHLHDVDWAYHAFGVPTGLYAQGRIGKTGGIDDVTAIYDYADGPVVTLRSSWMYCGFTMNARAFFDEGVVEFGFAPDPAIKGRIRGQDSYDIIPTTGDPGHAAELRYFLDCVKGDLDNTLCTAESTRDSVRLIELERRSIAEGCRLELHGKLPARQP